MNKKKKRNKILIYILIILFILIGIVIGIVVYITNGLNLSSSFLNGELCNGNSTPCEYTSFVVEEGSYNSETVQKLEDERIINNADIVNYWNRIFGNYSFYAGEYKLPHSINGEKITLEQLFSYLGDPANSKQDTITIKLDEGDFASSFAYDIASSITISDIDSDDVDEKAYELLQYWNDEKVVRDYMDDYTFLTHPMFNEDVKVLLEGYLFPDTYEFFNNSSKDDITRKILDRTQSIYDKYIDDFNASTLSIHEIFTLASIVQWETGNKEDSLLVAGALLNRIDDPEYDWTGGRLQSTVTACYAFDLTKPECDDFGDSLEYTEQYHPYNTYVIEGFPPGPVCCPNEISIYAALHPDQEAGYYYFVANMCDGGTAFAKDLDEHNRNINTYYLPCIND